MAHERLFVVGYGVGEEAIVVLVEIGDEVVIFVPAGIDFLVAGTPVLAHGVGVAVLVVVILD